MKSKHCKKMFIFIIIVSALLSFPYIPSEARAQVFTNTYPVEWSLNAQISPDGQNWSDNLNVNVGQELFYRITLANQSPFSFNITLTNSMLPAVMTDTLSANSAKEVDIVSHFYALQGSQTNFVTGTLTGPVTGSVDNGNGGFMTITYSIDSFTPLTHADSVTYNGIPVPEPATMILIISGILGIAGLRRKLKR